MDLKLWRVPIVFSILSKVNFWILPFVLFNRRVPVRLMKENMSFLIGNMRDLFVLNEAILENKYQQHKKVSEGDTVIDIGTGLGDFSILVSHHAQKVYSFDPDHFRMTLARRNTKLNKRKNIQLVEQSVKDLDSIFKKYKIDHCDFLKVDCEGWEYEIFDHSSLPVLRKIKYIAMEVHVLSPFLEVNYQELKKKLKQAGFSVTEEENNRFSFLRFIYAERKKIGGAKGT